MPFHVQISDDGTDERDGTFAFDLTEELLEERLLAPYRAGAPITLGGKTVQPSAGTQVKITETDQPSTALRPAAQNKAKRLSRGIQTLDGGTRTPWEVVLMGFGTNRTDDFITGPPGATVAHASVVAALDRLIQLCERFPRVARQLVERGRSREPVVIADEYDLEYVVGALLAVEFDDVRPQEWTPSYAGSSAKVDFLLKRERVVLELKRTRAGLGDKEIGNELIEDIVRYRSHADCDSLVCFVYDPDHRLGNPDGLISDLEKSSSADLDVRVVIAR